MSKWLTTLVLAVTLTLTACTKETTTQPAAEPATASEYQETTTQPEAEPVAAPEYQETTTQPEAEPVAAPEDTEATSQSETEPAAAPEDKETTAQPELESAAAPESTETSTQPEAEPAAVPEYQEGKQYALLEQPLFSANKDKLEVIEFFWYGCPHCYHFEPLVKAWKKSLPDTVEFVYSPAPWGPVRELHARAYYTAVALGMIDTMQDVMFRTLVVERKPLNTEDEIAALFVANGADEAEFRKVFSGFTVTGQVRQADARTRGAKVTGTPEMVVAGKYRVSASMTGSQESMLTVASYLVDKELAAKKAR